VKRPQEVRVINPCVNGSLPIAAVQAFWSFNSKDGVVIRLLTGLDVNTTYQMLLRLEP